MLAEPPDDDQQMMEQHPGLEEARARIERLEVENQIWRELIVEVREAAIMYAQAVWYSKATERARTCMASDKVLEEEVDRRLDEIYQRGAEEAVAAAVHVAEEAAAAEQEAAGGEADQE